MPDGKTIRYGVDTLYRLGVDVIGTTHLDEIIFKSYEEVESKIRYLKIRPGDVVLDVGACIGSWSIYAAIYGAVVHAFEVGESQLMAMKANVHLNNVHKMITGYKLALVSNNDSRFVFGGGFQVYDNTTYTGGERVDSMTLDRWANQFRDKIPHIEYIKIDVEGMEYDVLIGGLETIKRYRPKLIIEIHGDEVRERVEKLLVGLGYGHERVSGLNDYFYPNTMMQS